MNYRWMLMGTGLIIIGFYFHFLYHIPFSWVISLFGFIWFFFGYVIKRHDWYADYRERGARK